MPGTTSNNVEVVGVNDGDTITVFDKDTRNQFKVHLATIDAPEYKQPFGKKSRQSLSDLVYKKQITLDRKGVDYFGRVLAEVYVGGTNVNVEQIKRGWAWHYKKYAKSQSASERKTVR